jgi:hypothetical protein
MTARKSLVGAAACAAMILWCPVQSFAQETSFEYQIKAAFIYNFAQFVGWPEDTFASPSEALSICVAGQDPFGASIDQVVEGRQIRNRPLVVRRVEQDSADILDCHILFIGSSGEQESAALRTLGGEPVLTIWDNPNPARNSIIDFSVLENNVGFDINLGNARRAGLEISSGLLTVATEVTP